MKKRADQTKRAASGLATDPTIIPYDEMILKKTVTQFNKISKLKKILSASKNSISQLLNTVVKREDDLAYLSSFEEKLQYSF